jgi:hypothetical protein
MNIFEQFKFRKLVIGYRYDMAELAKKIADLDTDGNFEKIDTALTTIVNGLETDYLDVEPTIYDFEVLDFMEGYVKKFEKHYIKNQATIGQLFNPNFEICVIALKNLITSYNKTPKIEKTVETITLEDLDNKIETETIELEKDSTVVENLETVEVVPTVEVVAETLETEIVETIVENSEIVEVLPTDSEVVETVEEVIETPTEIVEDAKEEVVEEAEKPKKSTKKSK